MRKTWLLFPLVGLILILASGSLCGCSMRKSFLMMDDESIANKQFEKLIDAIQTQDIDAVRALFSENALKEAENADESIQAMFDYFHGTMVPTTTGPDPMLLQGIMMTGRDAIGSDTIQPMILRQRRTNIDLRWKL